MLFRRDQSSEQIFFERQGRRGEARAGGGTGENRRKAKNFLPGRTTIIFLENFLLS